MTQPPELPESTPSWSQDPVFLADLRRHMLKFARLQLADPDLAEDAVQEALIGALKNARSFNARAALKTWVFSILKYKIADALRQQHRLVPASSLLRAEDDDDEPAALFDTRGHWQSEARPAHWKGPDAALQDQQFWRVFEACLEHLPARQGRAFMMREFMEMESEEICKILAVSLTNLHVLLHRARLRLRRCLENQWFVEAGKPC